MIIWLCHISEHNLDGCRLGDRTLTVSYAEPKQSEMNQDQVKSVYVGNLPASAKEDTLREFFVELDMGEVSWYLLHTSSNIQSALHRLIHGLSKIHQEAACMLATGYTQQICPMLVSELQNDASRYLCF